MSGVVDALIGRLGRYEGRGNTRDGAPIHGELVLDGMLDGAAVSIRFRATGSDGSALHDERTWIGVAPDGATAMWTISAHARQVVRHDLVEDRVGGDGTRRLVFRTGAPDERGVLRHQVTLALHPDGRVGYATARGRPGEPFADGSTLVMIRAA